MSEVQKNKAAPDATPKDTAGETRDIGTIASEVKKNKADLDATPQDTMGVMRGLGTAAGVSYNCIRGTGKALRGVPSCVYALFSRVTERPPKPDKPLSGEKAIRAVVLKELSRVQELKDGSTLGELEKRLKRMAGTIEALQAKITELSESDDVSTEDMWEAVDSLDISESLTNTEKAVLVNIFRQNVTLQKPEHNDTGIE